jgi:hypothetical protein
MRLVVVLAVVVVVVVRFAESSTVLAHFDCREVLLPVRARHGRFVRLRGDVPGHVREPHEEQHEQQRQPDTPAEIESLEIHGGPGGRPV